MGFQEMDRNNGKMQKDGMGSGEAAYRVNSGRAQEEE